MKRIRKSILIICLLCFCLTSCGKKEAAPEPVEESQVYGEKFRVTIQSAQDWYKAGDFKKNCLFTMQLKYIGEEPEILIHHGNPLASIGIDCQNGKSVIGGGSIEMILIRETLKRGESYELIFDADDLKFWMERFQELDESDDEEVKEDLYEIVEMSAIKNGTLKKGTYKAVAYVDFGVGDGEDSEEGEEYKIRLPLTFEIR